MHNFTIILATSGEKPEPNLPFFSSLLAAFKFLCSIVKRNCKCVSQKLQFCNMYNSKTLENQFEVGSKLFFVDTTAFLLAEFLVILSE